MSRGGCGDGRTVGFGCLVLLSATAPAATEEEEENDRCCEQPADDAADDAADKGCIAVSAA